MEMTSSESDGRSSWFEWIDGNNIARWSEKGEPGYIELIVGESGDRMIKSRMLPCEWVGKVINWIRLTEERILRNFVVWSVLLLTAILKSPRIILELKRLWT